MNEIKTLIKSSKGKIFSASFVKKDGSVRNMVARTGVHKDLKGTSKTSQVNADDLYVTVYDMNNGGYRKINTETIRDLKINGTKYDFK